MGFNPVDLAFGNMNALRSDNERLKAENAKLRERIHELEMEGSDHFYRTAYAEDANRTLEAGNAKLRELVRDMWHEGMCECGSRGKCASCEYDYPTRMRELGIELNDYV